VPFEVCVSDAPELEQGADATTVAVENALRKARAACAAEAKSYDALAERDALGGEAGTEVVQAVLGCDTIVVLDGTIYGKPADEHAARATIAALAGRTHEVISGVALLLVRGDETIEERTALARTRVTFNALEEDELDAYVATEEWRGRSGGYAIQGAGSRLAREIDGEVENVVGLPLKTLAELSPELFGG
jgi:septum formation protein